MPSAITEGIFILIAIISIEIVLLIECRGLQS